jgi:hypothetical protein
MKYFVTALILTFAGSAFAQGEAQFIQDLYGMEKKQIINQYLEFSSDEKSDTFWELYNAYEVKRKELGNKRIELLQKYVEDYMNMPESEMDMLLNEVTKMNSDYVKLLNSSIKKIKKKVGIKQAAQFYQIENYLNNAINTSIAEEIPFIGELN